MLNNLGRIDVNPEVSITEQGKRVFAKLLDISEERAINIHDDSVWQSDLRKKKNVEDSCFSSLSITHMKPLAVTGEKQIGLRVKQKTSNSKKKTIMIVDDEEDMHKHTNIFYRRLDMR